MHALAETFDDLENPADFAPRTQREIEATLYRDPAPMNKERCGKCGGSGRWGSYAHPGRCFACKGEGWVFFKTDAATRAKARVSAANRKASNVEAWTAEHPQAAAWIAAKAGSFNFATAMAEALVKYGALTDRQLETVERLRGQDAERDATRAAERLQREAAAPVLDIAKVETAIAQAQAKGIKRPMLRLGDFKFSPAPVTGRNAGAVYVKDTAGEYLGKVQDGRFVRSFTCEPVTEAAVVEAASDPEAAAVAYGRRTGSCACCGRELTVTESIERGIGPVCAEKFGW